MAGSLSLEQKALLVRLVNYALERKIDQTVVPVPVGPSEYAIYVRHEPSLRLTRLSDLDALCAADVLSYRFNRMGNGKVYLLSTRSFHAVEEWRQEPVEIDHEAVRRLSESRVAGERGLLLEQVAVQEAALRQRLPAATPPEIMRRIYFVGEHLTGDDPNRVQISFQLRLIGRYLVDWLRDRQSGDLLVVFSHWVQAVYHYLDRINQLED